MKTLNKIISACISAVLLLVAPAAAILPPQDMKVVEGDISRKGGVNPLWLFLLAGYLIVIWLDIDASGLKQFCRRIWTERVLILLLLLRVFLLERRIQKSMPRQTKDDQEPDEVRNNGI